MVYFQHSPCRQTPSAPLLTLPFFPFPSELPVLPLSLFPQDPLRAAVLSRAAFLATRGSKNIQAVHSPLSLDPQSRIVGGEQAEESDYPYMVSLQKFWGHFCGASLIGSQWILTAAHCVVDTPPSSFFAEVGRYHLGNEDEEVFHRINVAEVHTHVCYDGGFDMSYDVALVKLEVPVVNPVVELYDGADPNVLVPGETSVTVAGWGNRQVRCFFSATLSNTSLFFSPPRFYLFRPPPPPSPRPFSILLVASTNQQGRTKTKTKPPFFVLILFSSFLLLLLLLPSFFFFFLFPAASFFFIIFVVSFCFSFSFFFSSSTLSLLFCLFLGSLSPTTMPLTTRTFPTSFTT